jgi:DNA-binding Lrp family transcriptional regulator
MVVARLLNFRAAAEELNYSQSTVLDHIRNLEQELGSIEAIKQCVKKGLGISLLPKIAVNKEIENGEIVMISIEITNIPIHAKMIYHVDKWMSAPLAALKDIVLLKKDEKLIDFNYLDEEDFHNVYRVCNQKSNKELSNIFEMHFIELGKFKKDFKELNSALDRWVAFLNRAYELDSDKIPEELSGDEIVKKQ